MPTANSKSMDWMTPERVAYESTKEWKAYRDAAEDWEATWLEFHDYSTEGNREALIASMSGKSASAVRGRNRTTATKSHNTKSR